MCAKSHKYSYTTKVKHKYSPSVGRIYPIQIIISEDILKLNHFVVIGFVVPKIGGHMSIVSYVGRICSIPIYKFN